MKRLLVHFLMDQGWLCSERWHGRIPFAPWCVYCWALEECARNHPEDWEEVEVEVARPLTVQRPVRTSGTNIYVNGVVTVSSSADLTKITKASIRGPLA